MVATRFFYSKKEKTGQRAWHSDRRVASRRDPQATFDRTMVALPVMAGHSERFGGRASVETSQ